MGYNTSMEISISEQNHTHIKRKIESGEYSSADEVITKALESLDESDEALAREIEEVRAKIQEGIADLQEGRYTSYTNETLHELIENVKQRGRVRRDPRNANSSSG
jgi:putative addiction module CopG family antidote